MFDKIEHFNSLGQLHCEDGPAVIYYNSVGQGSRHWYFNGERHREDGPAIEYVSGTYRYYIHGKLHREDGPAVEYSCGDRAWYIDGKLHRYDGPAVEYGGADEYYIFGERVSKCEYAKYIVDLHISTETDYQIDIYSEPRIDNYVIKLRTGWMTDNNLCFIVEYTPSEGITLYMPFAFKYYNRKDTHWQMHNDMFYELKVILEQAVYFFSIKKNYQ